MEKTNDSYYSGRYPETSGKLSHFRLLENPEEIVSFRHYRRAKYYLTRDKQEATDELYKSLDGDENNADVYALLGDIIQQSRNLLKAEQYYLKAYKLAPFDVAVWKRLNSVFG